MPLYSDHISNMYYSGSPSYSSASYGYGSSVSPYGTSYSASYLNPGGNYSSHSSLGTYARTPLTSRWIMNGGRSYSPILSTISEKGTSSPVRINSPRRTPISCRNYITPSYTPRPININTADIDVSRDKYRSKVATTSTSSVVNLPPRRKSPVLEKARSPVSPQPDDKPDIGIDSSPGPKRSTIKRDRTVVRLHTIKRKERDSPRKSADNLEKQENITGTKDNLLKESEQHDKPLESLKWRDKLANDLTYNVKKDKKTLGTKLVEKFILKDLEDNRTNNSNKQSPKDHTIGNDNVNDNHSNNNFGRRCSMEILAEQASLLDSLIREENLSTTQLDLSQIGTNDTPNILSHCLESKKKNIFEKGNPLTTTKSDNSLHDRLTSKDNSDNQQLIKRRSIKKSLSGNNIRKLDCISEFPRIETSITLNDIRERSQVDKEKPKLKQKITSTVEISEPSTPIKFYVENITVEAKPRQQKKDIIFSSIVDSKDIVSKEECSENATVRRKSVKSKLKLKSHLSIDGDHVSPDPEDGNFWDKIGKRETVYLIHRKQNIEASKEKNNYCLSWFPEEEENEPKSLSESVKKDKSSEDLISISQEDSISKENEPLETLLENTGLAKIQSQERITIMNIIEDSKENIKDENKDEKSDMDISNKLTTNQNNDTEIINENIDTEISYQNICDKLEDLKHDSGHINDDEDHKKDKPTIPVSICESSDKNLQDKEISSEQDKKLPTTDTFAIKTKVSKTRRKSTDEAKKLPNQNNLKKKILKHKASEKTNNTTSTPLSTKPSKKSVGARKSCRVNKNSIAALVKETVLCDKCLNNDISLTGELSSSSTAQKENLKSFSEDKLELVQKPDLSKITDLEGAVTSIQTKTHSLQNEQVNVDKDVKAIESITENIPIDKTTNVSNNHLKDNDEKETPRKIVKEKKAPILIATPRPLQKKTPQVIRSSSSSDTSDDESSDSEEASDSSEDSAEFFECENNLDGRTSTGSNDSGFDSSAPASPAGFLCVKKDCDVNCHRKCEKLTANLCGVNQRLLVEALALRTASKRGGDNASASTSNAPAQTYTNETLEQELEHSTTYGLFRKTGRFTPPARSIPRFRKYAIEDFQFIKVLGKGSFGKVMLAELRDTEYYYAVKCLKKDVVLEDDDVECTLIERKVLALGTNHPYLCHLFATFQTDSHLFFVMEYLNGGDLMFHIQQSGRFPEARARFYAAEIVSGLKFLHKRGIVYRDLKLDNILLDFDGHVRIADFGMCKLQIYLDKTADTFCGTPDYMAPEIIKGLKYSQTVDWWSFGVLLYEMLIGQSPFSGCDEDELFWSICNEMPSYPRFLSQESHSILTRLLDKDARTRLGGAECMYGDIRDQDFFRPIHWDKLERRELDAPIKPRMRHPLDTQYFDRAFTGERPRLTAVEPQVLRSMDQEPFRGFSYTNPNATDR